MSKWRNEVELNSRYAAAGILNALVGLTTIWGLTKLGANPILANFMGYAIALVIAFFSSKRFVFRSEGHLTSEATRYLGSFLFCYLVNMAALYICISRYSIDPLVSQGIAVLSYVISMYLASRLFVFSGQQHDRN